ncbi:unnamed protein product, partial [Mesorhabditis spiculigera]
MVHGDFGTMTSPLVQGLQYGGSSCSFAILLTVVLANIYLTLKLRKEADGDLTAKYQLAENVRTAQISMVYVVIENLLKIYDALATNVFNLSAVFFVAKCESESSYALAYALRQVMILLTPAIIFRINRPLRKQFRRLTHPFMKRKPTVACISEAAALEYRNPLGKKIQLSESKDMYFTHLKTMWK